MAENHVKAGIISASKKTDAQKKEFSMKGVQARKEDVPHAYYVGKLDISGKKLVCAVLEDGRRILSTEAVYQSMGRRNKKSTSLESCPQDAILLPSFISASNLKPYLEHEIINALMPIRYRKNGKTHLGYSADVLPMICDVYLRARREGALLPAQMSIAINSEILLQGLSIIGIRSLIDDATGYVAVRDREEFNKYLNQYIAEEVRKWTKKFPDVFFEQIYRLYQWGNRERFKNHPSCIGYLITKYIYKELPKGVYERLIQVNPKNENGNRSHAHHQWLSENIGDDNLAKQIVKIVTIMKLSDNIDDFYKNFDKMKKREEPLQVDVDNGKI